MKTKADFKARMIALGACEPSHDWVDTLPDSMSAEEVWNAVPVTHYDWLYWFARRNQSRHVYELYVTAHRLDLGSADAAAAARAAAARAADADANARAAAAAYAAYAADADAYCAVFRKHFPFAIMQWDESAVKENQNA